MILAILQARMSSSRLPGKVLMPLAGAPMIVRQIERLRRARRIDRIVVATSTEPEDDAIERVVRREGIAVHRGPLDDVLARFLGALASWPADHVVRLTADCPFADPDVIDETIALHHDLLGIFAFRISLKVFARSPAAYRKELLIITGNRTLMSTGSSFGFSLWPNPAKGMVQTHSDSPLSYLEIFSPAGKKIRHIPVSGAGIPWNTEGLAEGLYWVRGWSEKGESAWKSLIVR
ncbi:MAG: hypothetical protein EBS42_08145 [Caulobacteraceae bacterium]|nr:hypothetical protein [Caulobacteraceae bacterium]